MVYKEQNRKMGPDEYTTREELAYVLSLVFAKFQQHAEMLATISGVLRSKNVLTQQEFLDLIAQTASSQNSAKAKTAREDLDQFLTMHNIVRRYQVPPEG